MLAGLAHKWNWREARQKAGKDATRPNLVTGGNVQIVWKKFMRYFDVEPRIVPLKPGNYRLTASRDASAGSARRLAKPKPKNLGPRIANLDGSGFGVREIARILGVNPSTVSRRLRRRIE